LNIDTVQNPVQQLSGKNITYKSPKLRKGKKEWYIEYYFRVPAKLRHLHKNKFWEKFRVFEDINRVKTDEYAQTLLRAVEIGLKEGFDPFLYKEQRFLKMQQEIDPVKEWTCTQALNYFMQEWEQKGLEASYLTKLKRAIEVLTEWLTLRNFQHQPVTTITKKYIELALREASNLHQWENRTYNNNMTALVTVFSFFKKEKMIPENPMVDIEKKKSKSKKHRYYDPERFDQVRTLLQKNDPLLFFASKLIYYLCIRSEKELKHFKVGNIFIDRRQVLIQAEEAKTDEDRFIPIPEDLVEELEAIRKSHPPDYYVVGKGARVKRVLENQPSPRPFANNMLSARFAKIRKLAGFSSDYTLYGLKHTRIIHLKQDGGMDGDIMKLTGHNSYEAYAKYLRDLGIDGNPDAINKISRKF
jgi:integrase